MATARYYPQSLGPAPLEPVNVGRIAYIVVGVGILSALTVFLSLCARDNSVLLSVASRKHQTEAPPPAQHREIVSADPQPAADSITRVTVPAVMAAQPTATPAFAPTRTTPTEAAPAEKRAARHFEEFTLARSRRFQQVGPFSVGVWRIDAKHKFYDVSVVSDGHRVDRKHVSLNSPVTVGKIDSGRPLQFVVNAIERNRISGYVTEPPSAR